MEEPGYRYGLNNAAVEAFLLGLNYLSWMHPTHQVTESELQPLVDAHLERLTRFDPTVGPVPVRIMTTLTDARSTTRDAAWNAAWAAAGNAARAAAWDAAGNAAWAAAWAAAFEARYLMVADLLDWPSPWEPLLDIWRLGCWPIGVVSGEFVVFVPDVA